MKRFLVAACVVLGCGSSAGIHARMAYSEEAGLRVVDVPPGPAERAGLRPGDRIIAIDGMNVDDLDARETVEALRGGTGSQVRLDVLRGDETLTMDVARERYDSP